MRQLKEIFAIGALALAAVMPSTNVYADEPFLGEIKMVGYTFCPRGWVAADGQLLEITQYQALFSLYGTNFGGDGRTTFGVPDLRGRVPVHVGTGPGLNEYTIGQKGGQETVTLYQSNMPAHNHSLNVTDNPASTHKAGDAIFSNSGAEAKLFAKAGDTQDEMRSDTIASSGGGQPVNNLQPFSVIRFCVNTDGLFPSRN